MNNISVNQLRKGYQSSRVLNDVSFNAKEGTVTSFLGKSGAGKTTLFRILSGLEKADAGQVHLHGKRVGFIFQQFHLWKHMSVLENLMLAPVHVLKKSKEVVMDESFKLLKLLGIEQKARYYPKTLSGGEQQRVAIARALMMEPDVILFDEPTSSLDPERTEIVLKIIQKLKEAGKIVLIITHDIPFASKASNVILFLEQGVLHESVDYEHSVNNNYFENE